MKKVLLVHQADIAHYRVPVYNYLSGYLEKCGWQLLVVSEGIQKGNKCPPTFARKTIRMNIFTLMAATREFNPDAAILFINHSRNYFFPYLFYLWLSRRKSATWTHGLNLQIKQSLFSRLLHHLEHELFSSVILYAKHLRPQLLNRHRNKTFVANNTLYLVQHDNRIADKAAVLKKYGITTSKNIICLGRIQKRKRIDDLIAAYKMLKLEDVGLVLAGPDDEGLAAQLAEGTPGVVVTGPVYGDNAIDLMRSCDVYCIPGAIGLSIVDAQYCGLPIVTEAVDHGPEIMYLKDGKNGFVVPVGDVRALAEKLRLLLTDDTLRKDFSAAAQRESQTEAHIDRLCEGIVGCLEYLTGLN